MTFSGIVLNRPIQATLLH